MRQRRRPLLALQRTIRALGELGDVLPEVDPVVVEPGAPGPVARRPEEEIADAPERFVGREVQTFLPADRRATDAALAEGRTLPRSPQACRCASDSAIWPSG